MKKNKLLTTLILSTLTAVSLGIDVKAENDPVSNLDITRKQYTGTTPPDEDFDYINNSAAPAASYSTEGCSITDSTFQNFTVGAERGVVENSSPGLTINGAAFTGNTGGYDIFNSGTLSLTGSSLSGILNNTGNITLSGSNTITNGLTNTGTASNTGTIKGDVINNITIGESNKFTNSGTIQGKVTNTAGTFENTGNGKIEGNVTNSGSFTSNASNITGKIDNTNGIYTVTGGAIASAITKGTVKNTGTDTSIADLTNLMSADTIENTGKLTVSGNGAITKAIADSGNLVIDAAVTVNDSTNIANAVTINSGTGKSLQTNADNLGNTVTNSGSLTLTGGTVKNAVSGNGTTVIDGDVIISNTLAEGAIANAVTINNTKKLSAANASVFGKALKNNGTLELSGGELTHKIDGGTLNITGSVTNSYTGTDSQVNELSISSGNTFTNQGTLKTKKLTNSSTVQNEGTLSIEGTTDNAGSITKGSSTNSKLNILSGTFTNKADVTQDNVSVSSGATLDNTDASASITANVTNIGIFKSAVDKITGSIENNNDLKLKAGSSSSVFVSGITGSGTTTITEGNIDFTGKNINQQSIVINSGAGLTEEIAKLTLAINKITNDGSLTLSGGTESVVDNGFTISTSTSTNSKLTFKDKVKNNNNITQKTVNIAANAQVKNISNITADVVIDGTGSFENTGNGKIEGAVKNSGSLTSNASNITGKIDNTNGIYTVTGGAITSAITGGTVKNTGTDTSIADLTKLMSADTIENTGKLTVKGSGAIKKAIKDSGNLVIDADVTVNDSTNIDNTVTINLNKSLETNADNLGNTVSNSGTLKLTGGTVNNAVTGNGELEIASTSGVTADANVSNGTLTLTGGSKYIANSVTTVTNTLNNSGTITVNSGKELKLQTASSMSNVGTIDGTGKLIVDTALNNTGTISSAIQINASKSLISDLAKLTGTSAVTNNGAMTLTGGTSGEHAKNTRAITGSGTISFSNYVDNSANIELTSASGVTNTGTLTSNAINSVVTNSVIYEVTGGTISKAVKNGNSEGTTLISGSNVSIGADISNAVTVSGSASTIDASHFKADVENNGSLTLSGGKLDNNITTASNGALIIAGAVEADADVTQKTLTVNNKYTIDNGKKTTVTDSLENSGEIALNGANAGLELNTASAMTNAGIISGTGTLTVNTDLTNNKTISSVIDVQSGKKLISSVSGLSGTNDIKNAGTLTLTGGESADETLSRNITGTTDNGSVSFDKHVKNTGSITSKNVTIETAGVVTNTGAITAATFTNKGTMTNTGAITAAITNSGTLTSTASKLLGDVANTNSVTIQDDTLTKKISGSGSVTIENATLDAALISATTGTVSVSANKNATMSGVLSNNITGGGFVKIDNASGKELKILTDRSISNLDLNGGILNMDNGGNADAAKYSTLKVGTVKNSGAIKIDVNMTENAVKTDNLIVNSAENASLTLTGVNVRGNRNDNFEDSDYLTIVTGSGAENITYSVEGGKLEVISKDDNGVFVYEFTNGDTKGKLNVAAHKTESSLADYIRGNSTATSYSLNIDAKVENKGTPGSYTYDGTLGSTKGTGQNLTVNLNHGVTLTGAGSSYDGITVQANDTLSLTGEITPEDSRNPQITNFKNAVVNNGNLNIKNVNFKDNTYDIKNDGELNLSGTNRLEKGVTITSTTPSDKGITNITAGKTTLEAGAKIEQNKINITGESTELNANASAIIAAVENAGIINLSGDDGTSAKGKITKNISGNGILNVKNDTQVGNSTDVTEVNVTQETINIDNTIALTNYGHIKGKIINNGKINNNSPNTLELTNESENNGDITQETGYDGHVKVVDSATFTNKGTMEQSELTIGTGSNLTNEAHSDANHGIVTVTKTLNMNANTSKITNLGQLNLNGSAMQNDGEIDNSAELNIKNSNFTNNYKITDTNSTGVLNIGSTGSIQNTGINSAITQKVIKIAANGGLTTGAAKVTTISGIENHGNLTIEGSTGSDTAIDFAAVNAVTNGSANDGSTTFKGNVNNNAAITQNTVTIDGAANVTNNADITALGITNNGNLTSNANNIKSAVNNAVSGSTYTVNGGRIDYTITGAGKTIIDGTVTVNDTSADASTDNTISSQIQVNAGKSLETNADKIAHDVVNNGTVNLTGGTLAQKISNASGYNNSEVKIKGDVISNADITANTLTVETAGAKLTNSADVKITKLNNTNEIVNNGTLNILSSSTDASNAGTISGIGTLDLDNNLATTGNITQKIIDIAAGKTLTNASNTVEITDTLTMATNSKIDSNGNLTLSGSNMTIAGVIEGNNGTLNITKGAVVNNGSITQDVIKIAALDSANGKNPSFTSKLDSLTVNSIENLNKLELTGGISSSDAISNNAVITGTTGETTFKGSVKNEADITQKTVKNDDGIFENTKKITANVETTGEFSNTGTGEIVGNVNNTGILTTAVNKITGNVENTNTLNLTGAASITASTIDKITGTGGKVNITSGNVDLTDKTVNQASIAVLQDPDKSALTLTLEKVTLSDKKIENDGDLTLVGGYSPVSNENVITQSSSAKKDAILILEQMIENNAAIKQKSVIVDTEANVTNKSNIETTGAMGEGFINKGTFENVSDGSITGNVKNETGTITSAIDKTIGAVDNADVLNLKGGASSGDKTMKITAITNGTGTTNIVSGVVDNSADIEQKTVHVATGATLNNASNTINVEGTDATTGFVNDGTVVNGGTISGSQVLNNSSITNTGTISADISNLNASSKITNTGDIYKVLANLGEIKTIASGLKDTVNSDGTIRLNAGTDGTKGNLSQTVTGNGSMYIEDNITVTSEGNVTQGYIEVANGTSSEAKNTFKNDGGIINAVNALVNGEYAVLELTTGGTTKIDNLIVDKGTLSLIDGAELTSDSNVSMKNNANLQLNALTKDVDFYSVIKSPSDYSIVANSTNGYKVIIDSDVSEANSIVVTDESILDLGAVAIESLDETKYVTAGENSIISLNSLQTTPQSSRDVTFKSNISGTDYTLNINNNTAADKTVTLDTTIEGAGEINVKNGTLEIIDETNIGSTPINLQGVGNSTTSNLDLTATEKIALTSTVTGDGVNSDHLVNINSNTGTTSGLVTMTSYFDNVFVNVNAGELWMQKVSEFKDSAKVLVDGGATLNVINNTITKYGSNVTLDDGAHLKFDAHMTDFETDSFKEAAKNGTVILDEFNPLNAEWIVHNEAVINLNSALGIENLAYSDKALKQEVFVTTPIRKMHGVFNPVDNTLKFVKTGDDYDDFNTAIFNSPVAALIGGYLTQLEAYQQAFGNMDMYSLMTKEERQAAKFANKYAASDSNLVFSPLSIPNREPAAWFKPYSTFENVKLKYGPKVSNVSYGTFAGLESGLRDFGGGWDGNFGIYAGYNGSHQAYHGNSIYQNGATLGLVGMAFKDDFFIGGTINVSDNLADADNMYGKEDFNMLMSGAALKGGYNWNLAEGRFIIQPSFQTSYSFVNTFDYTNAAGVRINSDPLHAIQLEPQIKFIGNFKNGWQPYAHLSGVWNILDKTDVMANDVSLPELSIKPYARYGVGVRKTFGDRMTGFFQTFFTSGGRNGVGLQFGFKIQLGESTKTSANKQDKTPKAEKKYIAAPYNNAEKSTVSSNTAASTSANANEIIELNEHLENSLIYVNNKN